MDILAYPACHTRSDNSIPPSFCFCRIPSFLSSLRLPCCLLYTVVATLATPSDLCPLACLLRWAPHSLTYSQLPVLIIHSYCHCFLAQVNRYRLVPTHMFTELLSLLSCTACNPSMCSHALITHNSFIASHTTHSHVIWCHGLEGSCQDSLLYDKQWATTRALRWR